MPCNDSGFHDVQEAVQYGIVSYDWSNAKQLWARPVTPANCHVAVCHPNTCTPVSQPRASRLALRRRQPPWRPHD